MLFDEMALAECVEVGFDDVAGGFFDASAGVARRFRVPFLQN